MRVHFFFLKIERRGRPDRAPPSVLVLRQVQDLDPLGPDKVEERGVLRLLDVPELVLRLTMWISWFRGKSGLKVLE